MSPEDLLKLLKHILVWLPENNPIRNEVLDIITQLKGPKTTPDIDIVPDVEIQKVQESEN